MAYLNNETGPLLPTFQDMRKMSIDLMWLGTKILDKINSINIVV